MGDPPSILLAVPSISEWRRVCRVFGWVEGEHEHAEVLVGVEWNVGVVEAIHLASAPDHQRLLR